MAWIVHDATARTTPGRHTARDVQVAEQARRRQDPVREPVRVTQRAVAAWQRRSQERQFRLLPRGARGQLPAAQGSAEQRGSRRIR